MEPSQKNALLIQVRDESIQKNFLNYLCEGRWRDVSNLYPDIIKKDKLDDLEKWIAEQRKNWDGVSEISITLRFWHEKDGFFKCVFTGPPEYKDGCLTLTDMNIYNLDEKVSMPEYQMGHILPHGGIGDEKRGSYWFKYSIGFHRDE